MVVNFAESGNVVYQGGYSFPFTFYLPEWLPQSHLCLNLPDIKKPEVFNKFKIFYSFLVYAEKFSEPGQIIECEKQGPTISEMSYLQYSVQINVLTPDFSLPIHDRKVEVTSKVKSMSLFSGGTCQLSCVFNKDVFYPRETMVLTVDVDNSKCNKKIDKYKIKLIRRTQVFNLKTAQPIYTND